MMFGKCSVCEEKDKRIADLKEEILNLRLTLNPPARVNSYRYELEQDNLLNGANTETVKAPIDLEAEAKENAKIQREADAILTGNY